MPRLQPVALEAVPELVDLIPHFLRQLGFVPNSVRIMARRPTLAKAFAALNAAVMDPAGTVPIGLKRLIGHMSSRVSGCRYCMAHTIHGAGLHGVDEAKLAAIWDYSTSPLFSEAERAALDFGLAAAAVPNAVDDALFARLRRYWDEGQIVEILGAIAMYGFLNRWNDTLATPLEDRPIEAGERFLAKGGWEVGKHRAV